jgi:hypothetical protein
MSCYRSLLAICAAIIDAGPKLLDDDGKPLTVIRAVDRAEAILEEVDHRATGTWDE